LNIEYFPVSKQPPAKEKLLPQKRPTVDCGPWTLIYFYLQTAKMSDVRPHRGYLATILECRCPRCREGKLFKYPMTFRFRRNMEMNERCPLCTQLTDIEVGFYYGTGYVSYLIALLITGISFLLWFLVVGFSFQDTRFFWWIGLNSVLLIVLQPWLMRFSRSLWISFFVKYDPDWRNSRPDDGDRIIEGQMNNW
jgi:uncharacterized protein (DUF983 family)